MHQLYRYACGVCFATAVVIASLLPQHAVAAEKARPVCAVLTDPAGGSNAVAAAIEAELLQADQATFVERGEIQRVLREQQLQLLVGADAGVKRQALGKLLKADLIVLLTPASKADASGSTRVVAFETGSGLRLANATVEADGAEAAARGARAIFEGAVAKWREGVREIYAVPPFLNKDLSFEFDAMRQGYATLVEQRLLSRPGAVVVELQEAHAIADEIRLAGDALRNRPMPVFITGEFKTTGTAAARRMAMSIRFTQADAELGRHDKDGLTTAEAAAFAGTTVTEIQAARGNPSAVAAKIDPKAEATEIANRAATFLQWGNREEGLALLEASLLLDPEVPSRHAEAMKILGRLCTAYDWPDPARKLRLGHRALDHFEAYAAVTTITDDERRWLNTFLNQTRPAPSNRLSPELVEQCEEEQRYYRAMMLRLIEARSAGPHDKFIESVAYGFPWVIADETTAQGFSLLEGVLKGLRSHPRAEFIMRTFLATITTGRPDHEDERERLLDRLISGSDVPPGVKAGALAAREASLRPRPPLVKWPPPEPEPVARVERPGDEVTFRKLTFTVPDGKSPGPIRGWKPIGDVDLVLAFDLYVMRRPGVLERLLDRPTDGSLITSAIYDGRYVWVVLAGGELAPRVLAIDPQTKQQWLLAGDVPIGASIQIAALDPGEVFACGSVGRAWCSVLKLDPAHGIVERRVHEARRIPDTSKRISTLPADVTFKPQGMNVIRDRDGKPSVLVQRSVEDIRTSMPTTPLLIDVARGSVSVLPETAHPQNFDPRWTSRDRMLCGIVTSFSSLENPTGTTRLITAQLPDLVPREVLNPAPRGSLLFAGNKVHVVGQQWFVADRFEGPYRALSGMVPQSIGGIVNDKPRVAPPYVFESRHYGFVVLADEQYQVQSVFQAVLQGTAAR